MKAKSDEEMTYDGVDPHWAMKLLIDDLYWLHDWKISAEK